ncbi:MAG: SDR family NAD(P)-dependent oxidoreductase [Chloroflexota bacterium]
MNTVLITGATGGIGHALAHIYAHQGHRLVLVGRRDRSELDQDFFTLENYCQVDLADASAAETITAFMDEQELPSVDILIHNAGLGYYGDIAQQDPANITTLVDVNLRAPIALTHALLPHLKRVGGKIVLISSVVANLPAPDYAVYAATKAALDEFGDNLRIELERDNVSVQIIHPGATRTDMHRKSGITAQDMDTSKFPSAEAVATDIATAIQSDSPEATIGKANQVMRWAGKHAAGLIDFALKQTRS